MAKSIRAVTGILRVSKVKFSQVEAAFARGPISIQRDHEKRYSRAKHLRGTLTGNQLIFHVVMWKGRMRLVDGYTRVQCVKKQKVTAPEYVYVVVHADPGSEAGLMALYDQFDSPSAQKKATDRYDEGLRHTGALGLLTSNLGTRLPKSAPQYATGAATVRDGVFKAQKLMATLDKMGLRKNAHETLGVISAYLAVAGYADRFPELVQDFILKLNQQVFAPAVPTAGDREILSFRTFQADKKSQGSLGGGSNITALRNRALGAFVRYAGWKDLMPDTRGSSLTLVEFETLMGQVRSKRK